MLLLELVDKCTNVTVNVGIKDLVEFGNHMIECTRRELERVVIEDKAETYPTPQQVAKILGVDPTTLWRWNKRGYLVPIEIGGKRRYKMSDVKALLNPDKKKGAAK